MVSPDYFKSKRGVMIVVAFGIALFPRAIFLFFAD